MSAISFFSLVPSSSTSYAKACGVQLAARIKPYRAGRLVNQLKYLAEVVLSLPTVERSPDPNDDFLLALCQAGDADYLVTGDKSGLLSLERHHRALIVSAAEFASLLEKRSF